MGTIVLTLLLAIGNLAVWGMAPPAPGTGLAPGERLEKSWTKKIHDAPLRSKFGET